MNVVKRISLIPPDTLAMNTDWNEAVTYAREQLDEAFKEIKNIEGIMSRHDMDVSEAFIRLNKLSKSDQSWIPDARALGDLTAEGLARAAKRGLSLSDGPNDGAGPYVSHLRTVLAEAMRDPVSFDAARYHAKRLMSDNVPLCYELKRFACSVLGDEIIRPAVRKPKLHEARDAVLHAIICDVAERFNLKPTKNRASV